MKGLEIARAYFEQYGLPMLREQFPGLLPLIAAGLTGSGSECFGFDDEISRDHDFEPGFCLFLPDEETVSRRDAFLLDAFDGYHFWCRSVLFPPFFGGWRSWTVWQYSDVGEVAGAANDSGYVDLDVLAGGVSVEDLLMQGA